MNSLLFENEVLKTIKEYELIKPYDTVIVGVSGGADSVALLISLLSLKDTLKIKKIAVCHINHNLRQTAKRDENFVKNLCLKLGVDFYVKSVDVKKEKERLKVSIEEAGRIARYDFFNEVRKKIGAEKIATAHNLNDQTETFFLRLLRGSSSDGLTAIKPYRSDGIIRPLLYIKREDIEEYLKAKEQDYVTDETNFETDYLRNKIRLMLIPYLKENFDFSDNVILSTIELLKKDNDYIKKDVEKALDMGIINNNGVEFSLLYLRTLHDAVLSRVIKTVLENIYNIKGKKEKLDNVIKLIKTGSSGKEIKLSDDINAYIFYDKFIIRKRKNDCKYFYNLFLGDNIIKEAGIIINISKSSDVKDGFLIDDISKLSVRSRIAKDKVYINKVGHKKLQDLFTDKKISKDIRDIYPVILKGEEIIYIPELYKTGVKNGEYSLKIRRMCNENQ